MSDPHPSFFEDHSDPLERRVAIGLQKIGLALKHQTWHQATSHGLSPTQGQILGLLNNATLSASEVAAQLGISLPTVSDSVRVLVDKGLLTKEADPRHPRSSLLRLTDGGKNLASKVSAWPEFLALAVGSMSADEQQVFLVGLIKMIRTLQENGQVPTNQMCVSCKYFRPHAHEGPAPHHCALVNAPMRVHHLRVHCDEHESAPPDQQAAAWERFVNPA